MRVGQEDGVVGVSLRLVHYFTAHNILHIQGAAVLCFAPPVIQQQVDCGAVFHHMLVGHEDRAGLSRLAYGKAGAQAGRAVWQHGQDPNHSVAGAGHRTFTACPNSVGRERGQDAAQQDAHSQGNANSLFFMILSS